MKEILQKTCEAYITDRDTVKSVFKHENSQIYPVCANIFCSHGVPANADVLKASRDLIRSGTGIFSYFRGTMWAPAASMLAVCDDPQRRMEQASANYQQLKAHFFASEYLVLVALILAEVLPPEQVGDAAVRGRRIYGHMKKKHPFLTSYEDSVSAVMLALADKSDDALVADMEESYRLLRAFAGRNEIQSVSHVLALSEGSPAEKCARLKELILRLGNAGLRYGRYYELPVLAALSCLGLDTAETVDDMAGVDAFLAQQKGYRGIFGIEKRTRLMHAAMIVSTAYAPGLNTDAAAVTSALSVIAAQQAALGAVIAANTAAASVASGSN